MSSPSPSITIGLLTNETKPAAQEAARHLAAELKGRGVRVIARAAVAREIDGRTCEPAPDPEIARADFVVVFGGDGTLLAAARLVSPFGTPVLGVHLGNFGFVTEVAPDRLSEAMENVLSGRYRIEERLMLSASIRFRSGQETTMLAVNDVVVASSAKRMIHVHTAIGNDTLATYAADGVIVATPTGSTGYSLSAGGPLVHPSVPILIVTPICPHTLNARTLIVPADERITLMLEPNTRENGVVSADGQAEVAIDPGDVVGISRADHCLRLMMVDGPNFYRKIRSRWHYGERETS
ncbi:MAG: NAD(+)/NADH kinase [Capsulimonadales bacterium]|nr:NAD(+)/NADH kinase [Capsulimonadales bacterium]